MALPAAPVESLRTERPFPVHVDNLVLAGAAETATRPAGAFWVLISVSALSYMRTGGAAVVPGADVADGTGSFPVHPGQDLWLNVSNVPTFSIISAAAVVGIAWYQDRRTATLA